MKRRHFLGSATAVSVGLSGCGSPVFGSDEPSFRILEVANVMDLDEAGYEERVTVTRQPDIDGPGRLTISITNATDEWLTASLGASPPFDRYWGELQETDESADDPPQLQIVPDNREHIEWLDANDDGENTLVPEQPNSGCWTRHDHLLQEAIEQNIDLEPGETITEAYTVVGWTAAQNCAPTGSYRFHLREFPSEENPWSFTLQLTD